MRNDRRRLTVVTSHPIQYQVPLWRALTADGRVDLTVLYLSRHGVEERVDEGFGSSFAWDVDLLGGHRHMFVRNLREGVPPGAFASHLNPSIGRAMLETQPDAVLFSGLRNPSALLALLAAQRQKVCCLYRAESSVLEPHGHVALRVGGWLVRRTQAVLPIGTANDRYYDAIGYPRSRRFLSPYAVDNSFFQERAVDPRSARQRIGLDPRGLIVLYCGKLLPWKDPLLVVDACAAGGGSRPLHLLVAGDGPLRTRLERRARDFNVPLTCLGFVNQTEIPSIYSAADVLVLPSRREPWGLVVNEAMNLSLPVLTSDKVGAHLDLVRTDENGAVFHAGDGEGLARLLRRLSDEPELARTWGAASRRLIDRWNLEASVQGIVEAVHAVA